MMKHKSTPYALVYLIACFIMGPDTFAQIKIAGAQCIVPGTEYQYNFYGKWNTQTGIDICVEGGVVAADRSTCHKEKGINSIHIIWNEGITKGKISISSGTDNGTLNVKPTRMLMGGKIDSLSGIQVIESSTAAPAAIICTVARGGSCSPVYTYQWEQSDDNLHWISIIDATTQNLSFTVIPDHTTFLRRRVSETSSNSIAYSDIAIIAVNTYSVAQQ